VGTKKFSWGDLLSITKTLSTGSPLLIAQEGEIVLWTITEYLLAIIADLLGILIWVTTGGKRARKPKPLRRPGDKDHTKDVYGKPMDIDEARERLLASTGMDFGTR
jgi:hypothetical protein